MTAATPEQIDRARRLYAYGSDDNIEIDDNATISEGDDPGVWVSAWVWLPDEVANNALDPGVRKRK